jgi:hypothetical protein
MKLTEIADIKSDKSNLLIFCPTTNNIGMPHHINVEPKLQTIESI